MHCKLSGDIYSHILYSINILYGIYFSKLVGTTADDAALIDLSLSELNEADGGQQSDSDSDSQMTTLLLVEAWSIPGRPRIRTLA